MFVSGTRELLIKRSNIPIGVPVFIYRVVYSRLKPELTTTMEIIAASAAPVSENPTAVTKSLLFGDIHGTITTLNETAHNAVKRLRDGTDIFNLSP